MDGLIEQKLSADDTMYTEIRGNSLDQLKRVAKLKRKMKEGGNCPAPLGGKYQLELWRWRDR